MSKKSTGFEAFAGSVNLASGALGAKAIATSDEWFASMHNLVSPGRGEFDPDAYCDTGKVMDGWESRRRRSPGHDWCILKLGVAGKIRGVDIDTNHFLGNHPPYGSVQGAILDGDPSADELTTDVEWHELVPQVPLELGSRNLFGVVNDSVFTHVRLNMYPDGGVARLKVYGEPERPAVEGELDLAAAAHGGRPIGCSDMFFSPMINLISPGRAVNMGGGWETRRRRDGGHDWIAIQLGVPGMIERAVLDTNHFKGNYPYSAWLEGIWWPDAPDGAVLSSDAWRPLLPETRLGPHTAHEFSVSGGPFTHVRLSIRPCGGVSRMRLFGKAAEPAPEGVVARLNAMDEAGRREVFAGVCGSRAFAKQLARREHWSSMEQLRGEAEWIWWHLGEGDWLEAFSHHPRIGEDAEVLAAKFAHTAKQSGEEQAGVAGASKEVLKELASANGEYEKLFGHVFLICASGLTAEVMLAALKSRLPNRPADELRIAAAEQVKIMNIRLGKL